MIPEIRRPVWQDCGIAVYETAPNPAWRYLPDWEFIAEEVAGGGGGTGGLGRPSQLQSGEISYRFLLTCVWQNRKINCRNLLKSATAYCEPPQISLFLSDHPIKSGVIFFTLLNYFLCIKSFCFKYTYFSSKESIRLGCLWIFSCRDWISYKQKEVSSLMSVQSNLSSQHSSLNL